MIPAAYRATLTRLGLTHAEAARLLHIHPVTSRKGNVSQTVVALLALIEAIGVDEARRLIGEMEWPLGLPESKKKSPAVGAMRGLVTERKRRTRSDQIELWGPEPLASTLLGCHIEAE